ncbi:proto-oncogene serine/threonine-protein kinase mos [Leptinotarsa decemlineata]|uniref:proto-oncogene serine/threonine-protein kinase mos n=1 Tax=Leptinotarsa decemlineata TaxID=7539 RepID=UPI003D3068E0
MGTPLKLLKSVLSPKTLSPSSPRLLFVPKLNNNVIQNKCVSLNKQRKSPAKNFEYSDVAPKVKLAFEPVDIHVTNHSDKLKEIIKHDIFMNSPMKKNIIENGVADDRFLNILGKGSFGKVIRAVYKGTTVAMKLVKTSKYSSRDHNALNLNHPNIVKTLHIIGNEESVFSMILMEYFADCQDMQSILDNPEVSLDNRIVIKYAKDICEALQHCHENGILHLDLKPQNVLLCGDVCKICDFGNSAKITELVDFFEHQGTAVYTAPEILQGIKPTEKSDVYSLGILLWQMLARKNPYSDLDNIETVIYMVVKCHLRPDMQNPTDALSNLYQNCWKSKPYNRPTVAEISNVLSNL